MYCYVLKLLFLIPKSYFPNQAATSNSYDVLGLGEVLKEISFPQQFPNEILTFGSLCDNPLLLLESFVQLCPSQELGL